MFFVIVLMFVIMLSFDTGVFLLRSMNLLVLSGNLLLYFIILFHISKTYTLEEFTACFAMSVLYNKIYNKDVLWWKTKRYPENLILDLPQVCFSYILWKLFVMILRLITGDFINTNCCLCCFSHCSLCSSIISGQWRHSLLPSSAFNGTRHLQGHS